MHTLSIQDLFAYANYHFSFPLPFSGVCVDSRLAKEREIFFALPGEKIDGHQFLEDASAKGVKAAVVSKNYSGKDYGLKLFFVHDVLECLQNLAKSFLKRKNVPVIGVTGSVGKTTTKDFIATLLEKRYKVAKSPGNSNSQIGLPLAILNHLSGDEDFLVLEMGMTHAGQIAELVQIAPPTVAVVTMVDLVHAGNFASLEEITEAKAEIFSHPKTSLGIFSNDILHKKILESKGSCKKKTFSTKQDADFTLFSKGSYSLLSYNENKIRIKDFPFLGEHNKGNFLAAAQVAHHLGIPWQEILEQIAQLKLPERRLQILEKKGVKFINDSYNACEISVKAALQSLPLPHSGGRKIAVIGEMLELGAFSEKCHREVGKHALHYVDKIYCLGNECRYIVEEWELAGRPAYFFNNLQPLVEALRNDLKMYDVVLLKGSRSKGLWNIVDGF